MSTDFTDDLDTPTEHDLDECYGSKYLSAADLGDRKVRTRIEKIRKETMRQQGNKPERPKFVLYFKDLDKAMVLNATNKTILADALGRNPTSWVGADVGILAEATMFAGKPTKGLRLRVLNPPSPKAAPAPTTEPPKAPWDEGAGDPVPDFTQSAA